ncbi:MAG: NAD(P)-dependent glycerol-3-phosphate dehydrogenase [Deltaproteobacteria bacterium]|nr:NAD(P)-dependent glycerol-3-phosphate dehydrogenase [Deltaproteobacteria bacterium]
MSLIERLKDIRTISVVGAGAWGTALSRHLASKGFKVALWAHEDEVVKQIESIRENQAYLPGVKIPENVTPSTDLETVVRGQEIVILAVPSHHMRSVVTRLAGFLSAGVILVSVAKCIENETLMTMTQVFEDVLPENLAADRAALSGPSFAREVGQGLPTAVTVACHDRDVSLLLQQVFASPTLRIYTSQDVIGVELGGALKNLSAIVAGICDGMKMGLNARAAIITRGLAEITRLGVRMGANPLTFSGLAGMGDLVLTCTGDLSRNRGVGLKLGQGQKLCDILKNTKTVAEGVRTTLSAKDLAEKEGVDMPITVKLYEILYEDKEPRQAMVELMSRTLKPEIDQGMLF